MKNKVNVIFFDWGDTLMVDYPQYTGAMVTWPEITPMKGVLEIMPELAKKYKCAVISNAVESDALLMKQAFEKISLDKYFSFFITSKELGAKKPHKDFFLNALKKLYVNADETIMVGNDYEKDIIPAKEIGMNTILITTTIAEYKFADYTLDNFTKLEFLLSDAKGDVTMEGRTLCVSNNEISLYYATMDDKKLVFDMGQEDQEIYEAMFHGENKSHSWEEYRERENEFYTGVKSKNNYLLIECNNKIIGAVSYSYNQAEIENMEIDIWLRLANFTGKGLGTQTLVMLTNFLFNEYKIKTFIIRPSKENHRAIRAYEKSGFTVLPNFDSHKYYGDNVGEWGDGDYGADGTLNMIKVY